MTPEKLHADDVSLHRSRKCLWLVESNFSYYDTTNQKQYTELGGDTSPLWNVGCFSQATQHVILSLNIIIIQYKLFFLFIGRKPTKWRANNCIQIIMVCSCAMSSNCIWLQIILCSRVNEPTLFSSLRSLLQENWQIALLPEDIH